MQMQLKHIYWFGYYNHSVPSIRYRALQPLQYFKVAKGITSDFVFPSYRPKQIIHFIRVYLSALLFRKSDSVIVFQKIHTRGIYAKLLQLLLKKNARITIYDIDDAEYIRRPVETIHYFMQYSRCCTVGSNALQLYAEKFNNNVHIITSPVAGHPYIKQRRNAVFTIGWIGYFGAHYDSLKTYLLPMLTQIQFPVRLVIMGLTSSTQKELLVRALAPCKQLELIAPLEIDWYNDAAIYQQIVQFDVGIAPLLDTAFNRAKSAYKMKQYLSCGVPVLASPVGENNTFLQHGVNGFFCPAAEDFYEKIIHLHQINDATYQNMSRAARAGVSGFSLEKYMHEFIYAADNLLLYSAP